tara:strand:- start:293 stop:595 length:303 start_codon:yes stop_codon:yes gene_type:complete
MKLTTERLKQLIKEEMENILEENPLAGDNKTAAPNPLGGDKGTAAPDGSFPKKDKQPNPLGGDRETATPDNPQGAPIGERVAELEKVVKELIRFIQKGKK